MLKYISVHKRFLLLIAGIVWLIAGFNVARRGIISYGIIEIRWYYYLLSLGIFCVFGAMFFRMTQKHTKRILSYQEKKPFWYFFDLKAYIIMAVMIGGGATLRSLNIIPLFFVAFFYTGLGCALASAGIVFLIRFFSFKAFD